MAERIVIIGGGMVGLAFAITCQYALPHADILVLEARPLPTGTPDPLDTRASALNLASQSILSALGVWRSLEVSAGVISQIHVSHQAHFGSAMIEGSDLGVPDLGYVVENHIIKSDLLYLCAFLYHSFRKGRVWLWYLVLNVVSQSPISDASFVIGVVTSA